LYARKKWAGGEILLRKLQGEVNFACNQPSSYPIRHCLPLIGKGGGDRRMDELVANGKVQAKEIRTSGSDQKCSFKRGLGCAAVARLTLSPFYLAGNGF
jgi:hypothetical protein